MENLLHKCMTKATTAEGDQMKFGPNWVVAKRGMLKVFEDRIECGQWIIPNKEIKEATMYSIRSNFIIPGFVLKLLTEEKAYHFGYKLWKVLEGRAALSCQKRKRKTYLQQV
jgi:hypothetical protein